MADKQSDVQAEDILLDKTTVLGRQVQDSPHRAGTKNTTDMTTAEFEPLVEQLTAKRVECDGSEFQSKRHWRMVAGGRTDEKATVFHFRPLVVLPVVVTAEVDAREAAVAVESVVESAVVDGAHARVFF